MMNTQEKSLALAELMGLHHRNTSRPTTPCDAQGNYFIPYETSDRALAQFAAILLKHPEVITKWKTSCNMANVSGALRSEVSDRFSRPTQANILDGILRIEGKL